MIQYLISQQELEQQLEQEHPGWLDRAAKRIEKFERLGYYEESSSIWSEIKVVYMRIQHGKCAYCERQLEAEEYGRIEYDIEHFRPKRKVSHWELPSDLQNYDIHITTPLLDNTESGYHLLAYHPLNYCISCKTCNSTLKGNYFPIEGIHTVNGTDPEQLASEKPLLLNPVGDFDDDPASLISFHGLSPMATGDSTYQKHRGLVTIALFHLDDLGRKYLFRERAHIIGKLYAYLELTELAVNQADRRLYEKLVEITIGKSAPHTNCARSFQNLYMQDKHEARELVDFAATYLASISA